MVSEGTGTARQQYAPAGAAARAGLREAVTALKLTSEHNVEAKPLLDWYEERLQLAGAYVEGYRRYCWPVHALSDFKLAPFHLLASEGAVHTNKDHLWHMQTLARFAEVDRELFLATPFRVVDVNNGSEVIEAVTWWEELTASGGEGMVVKPLQFVAKNRRGLVQPAVKCRGREYLRIIYGPEYTAPQHLERLRARGLGTKRSRHSANLRLASKHSSASSNVNRCAACTSAHSGYSHWKVNRLIHGCK